MLLFILVHANANVHIRNGNIVIIDYILHSLQWGDERETKLYHRAVLLQAEVENKNEKLNVVQWIYAPCDCLTDSLIECLQLSSHTSLQCRWMTCLLKKMGATRIGMVFRYRQPNVYLLAKRNSIRIKTKISVTHFFFSTCIPNQKWMNAILSIEGQC